MEAFLHNIAEHYFSLLGNDIRNYTFIFESKRAASFFRYYLSKQSEKPFFAPQITTINEFIISIQNKYTVVDQTTLIFRLYQAYISIHKNRDTVESIDKFLFWAEIILKDFDSIDRALIDAKDLYSNIVDYKSMVDNYSYLSEELKENLRKISIEYEKISNKSKEDEENYFRNFIKFWESLYPLYKSFKNILEKDGASYEADIYRYLAENRDIVLDNIDDNKNIVLVGLFHIEKAEEKILKYIKNKLGNKAQFCWDTRSIILRDKSSLAYKIYQRNIEIFGNDYKEDYSNKALLPKDIYLVNSPNAIVEAKSIDKLLEFVYPEIEKDDNFYHNINEATKNLDTAIFIANEAMLIPTVSSLPQEINNINISISYPLAKSAISTFINRWFSLILSTKMINGEYHYSSQSILSFLSMDLVLDIEPSIKELIDSIRNNNLYIVPISFISNIAKENDNELLKIISYDNSFYKDILNNTIRLLELVIEKIYYNKTRQSDDIDLENLIKNENKDDIQNDSLNKIYGLEIEFVYHYYTLVKRLSSLIEEFNDIFDVNKKEEYSSYKYTLIRLLQNLVSSIKIPFEGDPLKGLQIMGLVEARNLDFKNIIILSANEGNLPKTTAIRTLIPTDIRKGFDLRNQDTIMAIDAYRFYRAIANAEKLILVNSNGAKAKGEASRFIKQLELIYDQEIKKINLIPQAKVKELRVQPSLLYRDAKKEFSRFISDDENKLNMSASALNTLIRCPICFYYNTIMKLREDKDPEIGIESNDFGTVVHNVMDELYTSKFKHKPIYTKDIESILKDKIGLNKVITDIYKKTLNKRNISNLDDMYISMVNLYIKRILEYDKSLLRDNEIIFLAAEYKINGKLELFDPESDNKISLNCTASVDRIDIIISKSDPLDTYIRIIDYKTGKAELNGKFEYLFDHKTKFKAINQLMLYCEFIKQKLDRNEDMDILRSYKHLLLKPYIYQTSNMYKDEIDNFQTHLTLDKKELIYDNEIREIYQQGLYYFLKDYFVEDSTLDSINSKIDNRAEEIAKCSYCPISLYNK